MEALELRTSGKQAFKVSLRNQQAIQDFAKKIGVQEKLVEENV